MINEDGSATASQLYMYLGTKQEKGANFAEKAGFTNGQLYAISVKNARTDNKFRANYKIGDKAQVSFNVLNTDPAYADFPAQAQGSGTTFARVEDGEWDPKNPNVYYFLTTESNKDAGATAPNPATPTVSRDGGALWRLTFKDVKNPLKGATLEMLLNGTESLMLSKPDNLAIDENGYVLIQEDPGNNAHVARVLAYRVSDGKLGVVAQFDKALFEADSSTLITIDEESSGIVNANAFLKKSGDKSSYFFFNAQVHSSLAKARPDLTNAAEIEKYVVEGGQYYLLKITDWNKIFA
jgi:secreted PhoX family phosphatase